MSENVLDIPTEQQLIRMQIDESRAALVDKIEMLEEKVAETVQSATESVAHPAGSASWASSSSSPSSPRS